MKIDSFAITLHTYTKILPWNYVLEDEYDADSEYDETEDEESSEETQTQINDDNLHTEFLHLVHENERIEKEIDDLSREMENMIIKLQFLQARKDAMILDLQGLDTSSNIFKDISKMCEQVSLQLDQIIEELYEKSDLRTDLRNTHNIHAELIRTMASQMDISALGMS